MKYAIGGVAFSGNKGASGMLLSLMQNIRHYDPAAEFFVLTYYPRSDVPLCGDATLLNGSPKACLLRFPFALWAGFARVLHLPRCFWKHGVLGKLADCDFFLDAAGISFSDGRNKFTIFNILTFYPALAVGCPVIKVSQALGPFRKWSNRLLARIFLPRLKTIAARGEKSAQYLNELNLTNVERFSDVAFSLECSADDQKAADELLKEIPAGRTLIGISPSQVVCKLCREADRDYLGELETVVRELSRRGFHCVIFPHSARAHTDKRHNNDLPVLREFAARLAGVGNVTVIDRELDARVLRMLIGRMDVLLASRFHAIVSAMAVGVPTVVAGWSHKYAEVLAPFAMDRQVMAYDAFTAEKALTALDELLAHRDEISKRLRTTADAIRKDNQRFFERFKTN